MDFLNTKPRIDGQFLELLPDFPSLLRWFQAAALIDDRIIANVLKKFNNTAAGRRTHQAILELRESLRAAVELWEQGKPLPRAITARINELMSQHPMFLRINIPSGMEMWFPTVHPNDLFAPLAYSAAKLFSDEDHTRVRQCDACVLHFLDTSKKGTRRWCSMELCGNRAKAAAFAARQRHHA